MSDYSELKRLAEKASPGPWWIDSHGMTMMSMPAFQVVFTHPAAGTAVRNEETGNLSHWRNDWDASYIATANPSAILTLIAENEALRESSDKLTRRNAMLEQNIEVMTDTHVLYTWLSKKCGQPFNDVVAVYVNIGHDWAQVDDLDRDLRTMIELEEP